MSNKSNSKQGYCIEETSCALKRKTTKHKTCKAENTKTASHHIPCPTEMSTEKEKYNWTGFGPIEILTISSVRFRLWVQDHYLNFEKAKFTNYTV